MIGEFMYGIRTDEKEAEANARRVYHLKDKFDAPIFMLGGVISARKSTLLRWIEEQEETARNSLVDRATGGASTALCSR